MPDDTLEQLVVELTELVKDRYYAKYPGIVEEVGAGDRLGKIKAKVVDVYGDRVISPWAEPSVPLAGRGFGMLTLPTVGDGVWIEFRAGEKARPIWSGFWFADGDIPDPAAPDVRVLVTPAGLKVVLDDDAKKLSLQHPDGAEITMTGTDITLKIGATKIVLSSAGVDVNNGALKVT